jgi:hypothetical protein
MEKALTLILPMLPNHSSLPVAGSLLSTGVHRAGPKLAYVSYRRIRNSAGNGTGKEHLGPSRHTEKRTKIVSSTYFRA